MVGKWSQWSAWVVLTRYLNSAWVTVSESFSHIELLKNLIRKLLGVGSMENLMNVKAKHPGMTLQLQYFTDHLREELNGRRYFVVLDDL